LVAVPFPSGALTRAPSFESNFNVCCPSFVIVNQNASPKDVANHTTYGCPAWRTSPSLKKPS
jgi:hypothetical protein